MEKLACILILIFTVGMNLTVWWMFYMAAFKMKEPLLAWLMFLGSILLMALSTQVFHK